MHRRLPGPEGLFAVWNFIWLGSHHLLVKDHEAILIDTGFWGEVGSVKSLLKSLNLGPQHLKAILLTHGHLDHTGNLNYWAKNYEIPVYAHPSEQGHIDGIYPYEGASRLCGWLEKVGGFIFKYQTAPITHPIKDGDELPFWGGLQVVHLPGHTAGHCGFYSARHRLLFSGDLFSSYRINTNCPPTFLNSQPQLLASSLNRVHLLDPELIVPNHYEVPDPQVHLQRFKKRFAP